MCLHISMKCAMSHMLQIWFKHDVNTGVAFYIKMCRKRGLLLAASGCRGTQEPLGTNTAEIL